MALWWLEPGWADATCMCCGVNIKASGGDPDWGYCYGCFTAQMQHRELESLRAENERLRKAHPKERSE